MPRAPPLPLAPLLLLLLLTPPLASRAAVDFCDADPRSHLFRASCRSDHPYLLLHIRPVDRNPYHALHDSIWPLGHYLAHCVSSFAYGHIDVMTHHAHLMNFSECTSDAPTRNVHKIPFWGFCALHAMATRVGGKVLGTGISGGPLGAGCYDKTVTFAVDRVAEGVAGVGKMRNDYRGLRWFGRVCAEGRGANRCDEAVRNRSMVVPLGAHMTREALLYMREAILDMVGVVEAPDDGRRRVRLLMYDRNDTSRRQWELANARRVFGRLAADDRVEIRFVHETPRSFKEQVEMYVWADVVLAPHGAGLVNSLFMREGSEVVEANKHCEEWVGKDRFVGSDWTGWHAPVMGINVVYVQCHTAEGDFKERSELLEDSHGAPTNGRHKYKVDEIMELMETVLERQTVRLKRMTERAELRAAEKKQAEQGVERLKRLLGGKTGNGWRERLGLVLVGPVVISMVLLRKLGGSGRKPLVKL